MSFSLKIILDRFEDEKAVLITAFGQEIFWPKSDLPDNLEIGASLYLFLDPEKPKSLPPEEIKSLKPEAAVKFKAAFKKDEVRPELAPKISLKNIPLSEQQLLARRVLEELLNNGK